MEQGDGRSHDAASDHLRPRLCHDRRRAQRDCERPFCGFNVGSTVFRANADRNVRADKFVFESPVLRLVTEFGYRHVYQNGADILDPDWVPPAREDGEEANGIPQRCIVIYRYYDDSSGILGAGRAKDITEYAKGLGDLVLKVKSLVCSWKDKDGNQVAATLLLPLRRLVCCIDRLNPQP